MEQAVGTPSLKLPFPVEIQPTAALLMRKKSWAQWPMLFVLQVYKEIRAIATFAPYGGSFSSSSFSFVMASPLASSVGGSRMESFNVV